MSKVTKLEERKEVKNEQHAPDCYKKLAVDKKCQFGLGSKHDGSPPEIRPWPHKIIYDS